MTARWVSWTVAVLAAIALAIALLLTYADHTLLRSDAFADRTAAVLERAPVRAAAARRVTDAVIAARPDLVALRPIVELGANTVVGSLAFRAVVRRGALDAHRSAFGEEHDEVTLRVRDAGLLVADAVRARRPDAARRVPTGVVTTVARVKGGIDGALLGLAERADRARRARTIAFGAALALALLALLVTDSRRASAFRLGVALTSVGGLVALAAWIAPRVLPAGLASGDRDAAIAAAGVWLGPLRTGALAFAAAGLVVALAAASRVPDRPRLRPRPALRVAALALAAAAVIVLVATWSDDAPAERTGRCNGHAALCDRRLDDVAFLGTHNAMSAAGEPGWLFAAQDAGIAAQLREGVHALLIDTHYGIRTPRGVTTDLSGENATREKLVAEVGEHVVKTA